MNRVRMYFLTAAMLAAAVSGSSSRAAAQVPGSVNAVAEYGEDLYDAISAGRWNRARAIADSLGRAAAGIPYGDVRLATFRAGLEAQLDTIRSATDSRSRIEGMEAANRVTFIAANMTRPFAPEPPAEIALLDFHGRELQVWAAAKDPLRLGRAAAELRATWNAARPLVQGRGGAQAAATMETYVAKAERAKTPAEYARAAVPILDQVDVIERVFRKR